MRHRYPVPSDPQAADDIAAVRAALAVANPCPLIELSVAEERRAAALCAALTSSAMPSRTPAPASGGSSSLTRRQSQAVVCRRRARLAGRGALLRRLTAVPRSAAALMLVLVLAVAAVLGGSLAISGRSASAAPATPQLLPFAHGDHSTAVTVLTNAAARLRTQPFGAGAVGYSRVQEWALDVTVDRRRASTSINTTVHETWYAEDGTTRLRDTDRRTSPLVGLIPLDSGDTASSTTTYRPGQTTNRNADIPTSGVPATQAWLRGQARTPGAFSDNVTYGGDIMQRLREGSADPAQTANLYGVLATLPGVFDAGTVTDRVGRAGHAIAIVVSGPGSLAVSTNYLIVDTVSGRPLEVDDVWGPNPPPALHLPPGPVVGQFDVLLDSRRVHGLGSLR